VLGQSYEEAADICGCAMGTVKSRLNRARLRLLRELGEDNVASALASSERHPVHSARALRG
jgi:DNA-directed RNA polymerase specialized sigma24 family protein